MNPVPRIQLNPWAVDDRVATQDAEALHAQHTAVKAKFFYSILVTSLAPVGVPFFPACRASVEACTCFVSNLHDVADFLDHLEVLGKILHFLLQVDY